MLRIRNAGFFIIPSRIRSSKYPPLKMLTWQILISWLILIFMIIAVIWTCIHLIRKKFRLNKKLNFYIKTWKYRYFFCLLKDYQTPVSSSSPGDLPVLQTVNFLNIFLLYCPFNWICFAGWGRTTWCWYACQIRRWTRKLMQPPLSLCFSGISVS